jgi:FlaA1/EpsC-like NDP-sugar epimerase
MLLFDISAVILCLVAAFYIRLGSWSYPAGDTDLILAIFASPLIAIPIFVGFGLYQNVVRYVNFKVLWQIVQASSIYAISWGLLTFMSNVDFIPRSVILINWLIAILFIGGSRLAIRWLLLRTKISKNVLIYGAGSSGRQLSNALIQSSEYNPIAFIDDSNDIYHQSINGLKVHSQNELKRLIKKQNIKEVLLAIPTTSRARRNEIINFLTPFPVVVRSLPDLSDLAGGRVKVYDLLEIDLRDLLGRDAVAPNTSLLKTNISKKVVLVTGAGGSIGSEICRQILLLNVKKLVLYEISESSLYRIEQELRSLTSSLDIEIVSVIGSILDKDRMMQIFNYYGVQTIYHAAAYKHVPLVESNQSQGVLNNTIGTLLLAEASIALKIETFVLISTDKAVRPTNIMGASKRGAELVLQAFAEQSHNTCFTMVRFGNVLDSSGSVIPLFKRQIKNGGPITVTHKDIVRYFMTIPEAVELVIQAGAMAKGGEVFVLDMGSPIKIYDLAVKMINLSGLKVKDKLNPNGDIEIHFTGLRPGEKLYEELLVGGNFSRTENSLIMRAEEKMMALNELEPLLYEIKKAATLSNNRKIYELLAKLVPEFESNNNNHINFDK